MKNVITFAANWYILKNYMMIESHPLPPFFPGGARILMLGSFPPPKVRWKMNFFYPNLQNDMWRIFGFIFFRDKNHFLRIGH
jgi:hypothetical protein